MDTMARVKQLSEERNISLYKLAQICGLPYSTLKNTAARNGQLTVDTIEQICIGLKMPLAAFFEEPKA